MQASGATLFVDDASWLLDSIRGTLAIFGMNNIATAASAAEAQRIIDSESIDHVVSDLRMPAQRGHEFLMSLKRQRPNLRCTLLTGFIHDLSEKELRTLEQMGIQVAEKSRVDTRWIADLVGLQLDEEPFDVTPPVPTVDVVERAETTSVSDTVVALRLENDTLRHKGLANERLITFFAQDLLDELEEYDDRDAKTIIGSTESISVNDLINEIRTQSTMGIRIMELDRLARRRLR